MEGKVCFKCGKEKSLGDFYKHPAMRDGHLNKCKSCTKHDSADHYEAKMKDPQWREKERARTKARQTDRNNRYRTKERHLANAAVRWAVVSGKLTKPDTCEKCGECECRVEAHHEDYSKQLEVQWLCTLCHGFAHRKERAEPDDRRVNTKNQGCRLVLT